MQKHKVTFYPDNKTVEVAQDTSLLAAAISAGIFINSSCGGEGVCGRCKVMIKSGLVHSASAGRITAEERRKGVHLACMSAVQGDCTVEIPPESRLNLEGLTQEEVHKRLASDYSEPEEIEPAGARVKARGFEYAPLTRKLFLVLPAPNLQDKLSDLERLQRGLDDVLQGQATHIGLSCLKSLGQLLRAAQWQVTVTLGTRGHDYEILNIEPGDTSARNFGVVFDIGTTTLTGQLVDLISGALLGTKATYNKQAAFGSDVITRIMYAKDSDGLQVLHRAVTDDINEMISSLALAHKVDLNEVTCVICAGNTTMMHLLLRVDPTYIRKEPYVPTLNSVPVVRAAEAEIRINPRGLLYCVAGVASYVGGDVTAGVLSCGQYQEGALSILIDIGTNGEVVLGNKEFLISAAASAGPAFEGSGVRCGMRAAKGAIQKVKIKSGDFSVTYKVIGDARPVGICGSGYIDTIAQMLEAGVLDKNGKLKDIESPRVRRGPEGKEFVLVFKQDAGGQEDIVITEADIENLKRAKAAIYSSLSILVKHMGFTFGQVEKFFIAGGFGTYLDIDNAVRIGLLPDLDRKKFLFIGNSSVAGARQMIASSQAYQKSEEIARMITYFELSVDAGYMDEYMAALFFPHTDLTKFPSCGKP